MSTSEPTRYDERLAAQYDDLVQPPPADATERIRELSAGGAIVEFGIGTGRMALPLSQAGLEVRGIDLSVAMIERLRSKPGGRKIEVLMGDFVELPPDRPTDLVLMSMNTLFGLLTHDRQAQCFANAERWLAPGGKLVVEVIVPDVGRYDADQRVEVLAMTDERVDLGVSRHHAAEQVIRSALVRLSAEGVEVLPETMRYAFPAELDSMAQGVGLSLEARWQDWRKTPFTAASTAHVSVWHKA